MACQRKSRFGDVTEEPLTGVDPDVLAGSGPNAARRRTLQQAVALPALFSSAMAWAVVHSRPSSEAGGYGKDPKLKGAQAPWPRVLTPQERALLAQAANALVPSDEAGPGAVELGVVDFLDEWLSAPYAIQQADLALLRTGLADLIMQPAGLSLGELVAQPEASEPRLKSLAQRVRTLVLIGWGTTPQAAPQLGFVGNEPRARFDGPPPDVLALLRSRAAALLDRTGP